MMPWASQDRCEVVIYFCDQKCERSVYSSFLFTSKCLNNTKDIKSVHDLQEAPERCNKKNHSAHSGSQQEVKHACDVFKHSQQTDGLSRPLSLFLSPSVSFVIIRFVSWLPQTQILRLRAKEQKPRSNDNRVLEATMLNMFCRRGSIIAGRREDSLHFPVVLEGW